MQWKGPGAAAVLTLLSLAGCEQSRELREWRPEDHQQPEGAVDAPETGASIADAAAGLFATQCAPCHGPDGRGGGPMAPPMAQMPDLTAAGLQSARTDAQLADAIRNGRGGFMPAFADEIGPEGIEALVRHVRGLAR